MVTIILANGREVTLDKWQKVYSLKKPDQIGKYFSIEEPIFKKNLTQFGKLVWNEPLIALLDALREKKGKPINLNSIYRTPEYQATLTARGLRTAKTSPHCFGMAADVDTVSKEDTAATLSILRTEAIRLGIKARFGWKDYQNHGQSFIHVDTCPHFYGKTGPFKSHNVPDAWRMPALEW